MAAHQQRPSGYGAMIVAVVVGGLLGAAAALVLFASPPTVVTTGLPAPWPGCTQEVSIWPVPAVLADLHEAELQRYLDVAWAQQDGGGSAPTARLDVRRCDTDIRVWGTPLGPEQRRRWAAVLDEVLLDQMPRVMLEDYEQRAAMLEEQRRIRAWHASYLLDPELSSWRDGPPPIGRQGWVVTRLEQILTAQHLHREKTQIVTALRDDATLSTPPSPLLPLAIGVMLGAGSGAVALTTLRLRPRGSRTKRPAQATSDG